MDYSDNVAMSQMLPVQLATWDLAGQLREAEKRASEHLTELASCCDGHKTDLANRIAGFVNDEYLAGLRSRVSDEDMRHRISLCRYLLVANTDSTKFVKQVLLSISNFVWNLYPETAILWSVEDLESAKAEAEFGRRVTRAMLSPIGETPKELFELNAILELIAAQLCRATYQGQAMELMARISSNQLELVDQQGALTRQQVRLIDQQGALAEQQLELIGQQTCIMERFDKQSRQMERMNKWINRFSIAAAIAAILALMLQALDVFHVIP